MVHFKISFSSPKFERLVLSNLEYTSYIEQYFGLRVMVEAILAGALATLNLAIKEHFACCL